MNGKSAGVVRVTLGHIDLSEGGSHPTLPSRTYMDAIGKVERLPWRQPFYLLCAMASALMVASVLQDFYAFRNGTWSDVGRIWLLDVDVEKSVYTWVSIIALSAASLVSYLMYAKDKTISQSVRSVWLLISFGFLFLSLDEFAGIHELLSAFISSSRGSGKGIFYFAWAVPAGVVAIIGMMLVYPFLRNLSSRSRILIFTSAIIFIVGSVGFEIIGGAVAESGGVFTPLYRSLTNCEEFLEFFGVALYVKTLMELIEYRTSGNF